MRWRSRLLGVGGVCAGLASCLVGFEEYPKFDEAPASNRGGAASGRTGGASSMSKGGTTSDGGEPEAGGESSTGGTASGGSSSGGTATSGGTAQGASAGETDAGEPALPQGGDTATGGASPTGGVSATGGAAQGGTPSTGGSGTGGAPSGGQSTGGSSQGGATGGAGPDMCTEPLRGSCSSTDLEYCIDGTWVPNDECGGCAVLSCGLACCRAIHAFVTDSSDSVRRPDGVTVLQRDDPYSVNAQFAFDSVGQIAGVSFTLAGDPDIYLVEVNAGFGGGTLDVALESDFGESGCAYPLIGLQAQLNSPSSCWGADSDPITQITVRLTNNGVSDNGGVQIVFVGVNETLM